MPTLTVDRCCEQAGRGAAARPLIGRGSLDKDGWEGDGPPSSAVLEAREDIVVEMKQMCGLMSLLMSRA